MSEEVTEKIRSVGYCIYSARFWQLYGLMVLSNVFLTFFSYSFKPYGETIEPHPPISDYTLSWAASIGSGIINALARIAMGAAIDKVGFKKLFTGLMVIQLINSLICYWAAFYPSMYVTCILVNYWCSGGTFAIFPIAVVNVFGLDTGP